MDVERTLPHNLEAERMVLGAILADNSLHFAVSQHIASSSEFFRDAHRRIYVAIMRLLEREGGSCDTVLVKAELQRTGELEEVGGPAYLASLTDGIGRRANAAHYAELVHETSQLRRLIFLSNKVLTKAYEAEEPSATILNVADKELIELQRGDRGDAVTMKQAASKLLDFIEARVESKGALLGFTSGFQMLDALTFGWQAGEVVVIAARPSIGKTSFVLQLAQAAGVAGKRGGMFSLEMSAEQLHMRMLSQWSSVDATTMMSGMLSPESFGRISQALGEMEEWPLLVDDSQRQTVWEIRSRCRHWWAEHGLDYVIIDYVQLVEATEKRKGQTRNEEMTEISRAIKRMARELRVPVFVLSQLSRASAQRFDPRPVLSDLRESGALEQDADKVLFLHRAHHREGGTTEVILDKNRLGPTGSIDMEMVLETTTFREVGLTKDRPKPQKASAAEDKHAQRVRAMIAKREKNKPTQSE